MTKKPYASIYHKPKIFRIWTFRKNVIQDRSMIGRSGNRICVSFHRPITTLNFPKLWKRVGDDVISFSQTRKVGPSPISIIFRLINDTGVYLSIGDELILFWTFRKNGKIDRWLVDRHNRVRCYSGLWWTKLLKIVKNMGRCVSFLQTRKVGSSSISIWNCVIIIKKSSRDRANSVKRDYVGPFPGVSA